MALNCLKTLRISLANAKYILCLITPILLLPFALSEDKASRCAFVTLWMSVFWLLEPVHLGVTALMPVVLMPLLEILPSEVVCRCYMNDVTVMFLGGLAVATAVEHSHLHERIALSVLMILGSSIKWLMLGFMLTTMFMSMWISNTATTAMMIPIVNAVMEELGKRSCDNGNPVEIRTLRKTFLLSIAYAANFGGTGTITGTSPNMILKGQLEELHPGSAEITYASWMIYNVPGMVICVLIGWIVLQLLYAPCWKREERDTRDQVRRVISDRYHSLGSISFHEIAVSILFVVLVFLWVFRDPKFMPGWADAIASGGQIGNSVPVMAILYTLLLVPAEPLRLQTSRRLLDWPTVQRNVPWGLVLLMGGGYALSKSMNESGLTEWLGKQMMAMATLPPEAVAVILCISTAVITEILSNAAVVNIMLPIVSQMAVAFKVNPLYLMLPVTVSASYAFMLPVATGPGALVFDSGRMKTLEMVKPGIPMNIAACLVQVCMVNTLGVALFDLKDFPAWANAANETNSTAHM